MCVAYYSLGHAPKYCNALTFRCGVPIYAEILEGPQNQYILEGTNATITCIAYGSDAFWNINGTVLSYSHKHQRADYEAMGVVFIDNLENSMSILNLTMIVPACVSSAVKNIKCIARDVIHRQTQSGIANIFVFKTFRE